MPGFAGCVTIGVLARAQSDGWLASLTPFGTCFPFETSLSEGEQHKGGAEGERNR